MHTFRLSFLAITLFALVFILGKPRQATAADIEKVIYSFCDNAGNCPDGAFPYASLAVDASGILYSTTNEGGGNASCNGSGCGTVFRLKNTGASAWAEEVLHVFPSSPTDGTLPESGVTIARSGTLLGTTFGGGLAYSACAIYGCGIVYELTAGSNGQWSETVVYSFCSATNCSDGNNPVAGLTQDAEGNLFGVAALGGIHNGKCPAGCGTVFELSPVSGGSWRYNVLFRFNSTDGQSPQGGLVLDTAGNLYGTTTIGGAYGLGTVYELVRGKNGTWTQTVLHSFNTADGRSPLSELILDSAGNLYGTTFLGGTGAGCVYSYGCGTAFELSPGSNGAWNEQVLYSFCQSSNCLDGANPWGGLLLLPNGVLCGTTSIGGAYPEAGTVFALSHNTTWNHTVVYNMGETTGDGLNPQATLLYASGNLFGTAAGGGSSTNCNNAQGCGAVFEILAPKAEGIAR